MAREASIDTEPGGEYLQSDEIREVVKATSTSSHVSPKGTPGNGSAAFLFLVGLALVGAGAALVLAPRISLQLVKVGRELASYGIQPGLLLVAGTTVFSMGFVARSVAAAARASRQVEVPQQTDSDFMLVADQLAADLAQVLSSLLQITEEVGSLGESQRTLLKSNQKEEGASEKPDQMGAIFRMAASIDQLGARVDERMHEVDVQLRSRFDTLGHAVDATRASAQALLTKAQQAPAPVVQAAPAAPVARAPQTAPPAIAPQKTVNPELDAIASDLCDVGSVDLGALDIATSPIPAPAPVAEPTQVEMEDEALDTLDALLPDDPVRELERRDGQG